MSSISLATLKSKFAVVKEMTLAMGKTEADAIKSFHSTIAKPGTIIEDGDSKHKITEDIESLIVLLLSDTDRLVASWRGNSDVRTLEARAVELYAELDELDTALKSAMQEHFGEEAAKTAALGKGGLYYKRGRSSTIEDWDTGVYSAPNGKTDGYTMRLIEESDNVFVTSPDGKESVYESPNKAAVHVSISVGGTDSVNARKFWRKVDTTQEA